MSAQPAARSDRPVILYGMAATGLYLLHQVRKVTRTVHCIGRPGEMGMLSRFGRKIPAASGGALMEATLRLVDGIGEKPIGYLSSDFFITTILEECPGIFELVQVMGPAEATYRVLNDKHTTYAFARAHAVSVPRTAAGHSVLDEGDFPFPAILKWSSTDTSFVESPGYHKTRVVTHREELARAMNGIAGDRSKVIVQQYLADEDYPQVSYGGFFANGKPLASMVVRQLRQYPRGTSSFVLEVTNEPLAARVSREAVRLAAALKLDGFCEFEFRCSGDGSEAYLLDVNPRTWGWVRALGSRYPRLHTLLLGGNAPLEPRNRPVLWVNPLRDALALARNVRSTRRVSIPATTAWRGRCVSLDGVNLLDPLPAMYGWSRRLLRLFAR